MMIARNRSTSSLVSLDRACSVTGNEPNGGRFNSAFPDTSWAGSPREVRAVMPPVAERASEVGCYLDATELLGELPQVPLFWHLYNYPTRAAAEAAKGPRGTVVESVG